jgi:hypothetical protein
MGPVGSWDGLEVVQGVRLGHRATWFGGGRARPAPASAPLPPPRTSGWHLAGKAVRLFSPYAVAADANTCPGSACYTASSFLSFLSRPRSVKFWPISPLSQSFLGEEPRNGSGHYFLLRDLSPLQLRNQQMSSSSAGSEQAHGLERA